MLRVLFVSDDWNRKKGLKSTLANDGCTVIPVVSPHVFQDAFSPEKIDVLVVDLERCASDQAKLFHAIRREPSLKDLPLVLLLTEDQLGRVDFSLGIDDYLTLPVSPKRLAERLKFLIWKRNRIELKNGLSQRGLAIDFERYEVHIKGELIDLTYKEFQLLKFLAMNPGKVFTRDVLLNKVWGYDFYGGTRTVDVHVRRLRAKIETHGASYIETVRNVGYKFLADG